jgi:hypothetical protein
MLAKESVERIGGEARELGIAERYDMGIARPAGNEPHFPHRITGHDATDEAAVAALCGREDAEATAKYDIQRIRRIASGKQRGAAW